MRLPELIAASLCALAVVAGVWVSTEVFDRLPHVEDEFAYLFQARTLAAGSLLATAPAHPQFFEMPFIMVRDGQWFGKYPPGYPAILALGVLADQPWLVNPLMGALSLGLVYLVGRQLYSDSTGLLAAGLLISSPFFLLQTGSLMSHAACLFWTLAWLFLFALSRESRSAKGATAAGVALGALFLSRPATAVGVAIPCLAWASIDLLRSPFRLGNYLLMALGCLPFVAGFLAYNRMTTGDPLHTAYELWWEFDRFGFGEGRGPVGRHTLEQGLVNTRFNFEALADYLFGWPERLSLLPAALAAALATASLAWLGARAAVAATADKLAEAPRLTAYSRQEHRMIVGPIRLTRNAPGGSDRKPVSRGMKPPPAIWDLLLLGVAASLVAVHILYWYGDQVYGPRFYFEALGALVLLSARGILQMADLTSALLQRIAPRCSRPCPWITLATLLPVAGLVVHSFASFTPREFNRFTRWYGIDRAGLDHIRAAGPQNALVFVKGSTWTDYAPFLSQNTPSLGSNVVYAIDLGQERNRQLMAQYPERTYFTYVGGSLAPVA